MDTSPRLTPSAPCAGRIRAHRTRAFVLATLLAAAAGCATAPLSAHAPAAGRAPVEVHQQLDPTMLAAAEHAHPAPTVALTLDACGGATDTDLVALLIERRIPATVFATRRWIARNPAGLALLLAHPELFEIEDHGADHLPAVLGADVRVYGLRGVGDLAGLKNEVQGGAAAILAATGHAPHWYRGATAMYDDAALAAIQAMGMHVAGFSLNADAGATLPRAAVAARVRAARDGDVIIAHMNRPRSDTAEGLALALADLQARGYRFVRLDEIALAPVRVAAR